MPGGDRTGPLGQGPRTGRGFGYCTGNDAPGYFRGYCGGRGPGMGYGRGMGRGRGFHAGRGYGFFNPAFSAGYPWMASMSKEDEIRMLKSQVEGLDRSRKAIEKRLEELEKE
jgi:hypothetical protein